ncbi:helix-turn-helix domain-containing protein [Cecembia calidifontis]|uniref:Regulatory LuxR family protein n=1 Tax=Cecembia calidifontis TaxID=1187080 RepID=A0A4Q7P9K6_9BACT|nr:helix-turn-helix transcriptional regulator [Cecembia calidifontis]RZS96597.1 regulatory LuxR family protein [Cecembia calidifontis]
MEKDNLNWKMKIINPINTKFCLVLFTIISSFQYSFGQGGIPNLPESLKTIPFGTEIKELKPNKIHEKISILAYSDILEVNTSSEKEWGLYNWHVIFLGLFLVITQVIIFYFIRKWKQKKRVTPLEKKQILYIGSDFDFEKINTKLPSPLTNREIEIINLVEEGLTNSEIATKLFVSKNTVKTHLKNIFSKTHAINRTDLIHKLRSY